MFQQVTSKVFSLAKFRQKVRLKTKFFKRIHFGGIQPSKERGKKKGKNQEILGLHCEAKKKEG
jgi:hypothetical protein